MTNTELKIIIAALDHASPDLAKAKNALEKMADQGKKAADVMAGLTARLGAFATAAGAIGLAKSFIDTGMSAERMRLGLDAALGSAQKGAEAQKFLRIESERLGLVYQDQLGLYRSLAAATRGTALEGEKTRTIYSSLATAGAALGMTSEQLSGAMNALQQMVSKGTVASEELRGQLGERLPGAFQIAAKAMGVTTAQLGKMLEEGQVAADDFLPKFAAELQTRFAPAVDKAAQSAQAHLNRLNTAWFEMKATVMDSGLLTGIAAGIQLLVPPLRMLGEQLAIVVGYWSKFAAGPDDALLGQAKALRSQIATLEGELGNAPWWLDAWKGQGYSAKAKERLDQLKKQLSVVEGSLQRDWSKPQGAPAPARSAVTKDPWSQQYTQQMATKDAEALLKRREKEAKEAREQAKKQANDAEREAAQALDRQAKQAAAAARDIPEDSWARRYAPASERQAESLRTIKAMQDWETDRAQKAEKAAEDRAKAEAEVSAEIKRSGQELHDYQMGLLDEQKAKYLEAGVSRELVDRWYTDQSKTIAEKASSDLIQLSHRTAEAMENNFSEFFFDMFQGKLRNLSDYTQRVLQSLQKLAADYMGQLAKTALFGKDNGAGGLAQSAGKWLSGLISGGYTAPVSNTAASSFLALVKHAGGAVDGAGTMRFAPAAMFAAAPRLHGGLAADEFPAILQRGETVIPKGGGSGVTVNYAPVINAIDTRSGLEFLAGHRAFISGLVAEAAGRTGRTVGVRR